NISSKNAAEFSAGLDTLDYELIKLMDNMQQETIVKKFNTKNAKPKNFLTKLFEEQTSNASFIEIQKQLEHRLEIIRYKILAKLSGRRLFEMGNDGNPVWKEIDIMPKRASVLFHFRRNEENTHYFPTIKYDGEKLDWQYRGGYLVCKEPAWLVVENSLYSFEKNVDGKKLMPFLNKKFIVVPRKVEKAYYEKFVKPLVSSFDVYAKGFEIKVERYRPQPLLSLSILQSTRSMDLFASNGETEQEGQIVFDLKFKYGDYAFRADQKAASNVELEQREDNYIFYKVIRDLEKEKSYGDYLKTLGLPVRSSRLSMEKAQAFDWINLNREALEQRGVEIFQNTNQTGNRYFLGRASISVEVNENIDWFDVKAVIEFGEFKIPFSQIRKMVVQGKSEFKLPNGEIAVIPKSWFANYSEMFSFMEEERKSNGAVILKKHHVALASELKNGNLIKLNLSEKLQRLRDFSFVGDYELPVSFHGTLRPYQK